MESLDDLYRHVDHFLSLGAEKCLALGSDFDGADLPDYLNPGDCLILNNSRVLPARLIGHRLPGGGACEVLLLPQEKLTSTCGKACDCHRILIENMLSLISRKAFALSERVEVLSCRTIREKLLSFLSAAALKNKSSVFNLPLNRQQMADYLCVDRSAMSTALGKLRDEGVLTFQKNHFHLLQQMEQTD